MKPDPTPQCVHGKNTSDITKELWVPITAQTPQRLHQAVPPCNALTGTHTSAAALSFIAQEIGMAEAGWCSTKLFSYKSKAIAVSCIHRLLLCTAMYTNAQVGPYPLVHRRDRGKQRWQPDKGQRPDPALTHSFRSSCHQPAGDRGNTGSLG